MASKWLTPSSNCGSNGNTAISYLNKNRKLYKQLIPHHAAKAWWGITVSDNIVFLFLMSLDILRRLDIREDIVLQILELRLLLRFLQIAIRQYIIAETAIH